MYSVDGYLWLLGTAAEGLRMQALAGSEGLHSVFGAYGIQALTITPYKRTKKSKGAGWIDIGRYWLLFKSVIRMLKSLLSLLPVATVHWLLSTGFIN